MKTKRLVSFALAFVLVLGLTACGGSEPESSAATRATPPAASTTDAAPAPSGGAETEPAGTGDFLDEAGLVKTLDNPDLTIVYWYSPQQYAYDTKKNENVYDPVLEAIPYFEERYGGTVTVKYAAWGDMLETVIALQNSGEAPDLFEVYDETLYSVILSGVTQNLDAYTSDVDYDYYKINKETFQWKGSYYAIPLKPYAFYIMFNRDMFELEGLDTPDEMYRNGEWTWDNFRTVCKRLTKTVDGEVSQLAFGSWEDTILSFMYANGGSLLNIDTKSGEVTSNLGSVNTQNTLNYLLEVKDSFVFGNDMFGWFDNGGLAMIRGKEFPVDVPFDVGMVPFPTGDDYTGKNLVVYPQGMAVPTGAKNPEGAVAFMRVVNELQKKVGDQKEANRIGQENFDMIYADDVNLVYAYDKGLDDINTIIATIVNYLRDGVPAATINANMESAIQAQINLMYGN